MRGKREREGRGYIVISITKAKMVFREHWKRYSIAIGALLIVNIVEVIPPKVLGVTIDNIKTGTLSNEAIIQSILILIGVTIVGYGLTFVWQHQLFGGAFVLEKTMRSKFMGHLLKMTPTFYQKNRTGDLMARATMI